MENADMTTLDGQVNLVLVQNNGSPHEHTLRSFLGTEPHFQEIPPYGLGIDTTYDTEVNIQVVYFHIAVLRDATNSTPIPNPLDFLNIQPILFHFNECSKVIQRASKGPVV